MRPAVSGSENRDNILANLEARGVLTDLIDGIFRYCDEHGVLSENEETGIEVCRAGLTEHVRRQRGLCIACEGTPKTATRPARNLPLLWCEGCWQQGRYRDGLTTDRETE
jgi:hypothetical protein